MPRPDARGQTRCHPHRKHARSVPGCAGQVGRRVWSRCCHEHVPSSAQAFQPKRRYSCQSQGCSTTSATAVRSLSPGLTTSICSGRIPSSTAAVVSVRCGKARKPPLARRCHINFSHLKYRSFSKCVLRGFNDLRDFKFCQKDEICRLLS